MNDQVMDFFFVAGTGIFQDDKRQKINQAQNVKEWFIKKALKSIIFTRGLVTTE